MTETSKASLAQLPVTLRDIEAAAEVLDALEAKYQAMADAKGR